MSIQGVPLLFWINISRGDLMQDMPYFMNDEKWYYFDYEKRVFMLTEKAPKEATESYKQFYKVENEVTNG